MRRAVIAFDVGATWTRAEALVGGQVVARRRVRTPRGSDGEEVARALAGLARELAHDVGAGVSSVGVAVFGPIDYGRGAVVNPPNHPARLIPLRRVLEQLLDAPVIMINDAVAGAISGAHVTGARDLVYVALGTGVGVGVIVDGEPLLGRRGDSHEAGHVVLDYRSASRCGCGGRGHWEALYSGRALERGEAASEPDRVVAAGIASLVACYDPEIVLLGGGLVESGLVRVDRLPGLVREYSFQARVPRIMVHPLGPRANLYGAYLAATRPTRSILRLNGW